MLDRLIHKWLRIPYTLHVREYRKVKRAKATILFIHGIGNNGSAWDEVIKRLPDDVQVVTIDLLGFGESPKPHWARYDAKAQANSVLATYFTLGLSTKLIIVGHSLGSLVAIEIAKRYPLLVSRLILCAPPLYLPDSGTKLPRNTDAILRRLYKQAEKYPDQFAQIAAFATKYQLVNKSFSVTQENLPSYLTTLREAILNQTSIQDIPRLKLPIDIIVGAFDPVVIGSNILKLKKSHTNISVKTIAAGHEVKAAFIPAVVSVINSVTRI
ncbi:MAG TPA: alpha/beta hydrolase [Candidatus Saccharimonadales bacterium]